MYVLSFIPEDLTHRSIADLANIKQQGGRTLAYVTSLKSLQMDMLLRLALHTLRVVGT